MSLQVYSSVKYYHEQSRQSCNNDNESAMKNKVFACRMLLTFRYVPLCQWKVCKQGDVLKRLF